MKLKELEQIINTSNFQELLEKQLVMEVDEKTNETNPFNEAEITNNLIISTIIHCTVILASIIYLLHKKTGVNT